VVTLKPYDAKNSQTCKLCCTTFLHNKQGRFTSHLLIEHSVDLHDYLIAHIYNKEDLTCSNKECQRKVKLRRGVPNDYCSIGCAQRRSKKRKCERCGNLFEHHDLRVKTCSSKCSKELVSQKVTLWHSNMSETKKEMRFKNIIKKTASTRKKNNTPSWNSGKKGVYTEETIQKIREATLKQMHNQRIKKTEIEKIIENLLSDLNIRYKYSFILGKRQYDFILLDYDVIIECDGDYWHANPKFYPNPREWQKERQKIDIEKNKIAKKNGYEILRFWEDDIQNNLNCVKKTISSYVTC
jgi:very-short-patch-repair endonuclease